MVEHLLAKEDVASSNLVFRSMTYSGGCEAAVVFVGWAEVAE